MFDIGVRVSTLQTSENVNHQETLKSFLKPITQVRSLDVSTKRDDLVLADTCTRARAQEFPSNTEQPNNVLSADLSAAHHKLPPTPMINFCPLCGSQMSTKNSILNQHIDQCLNKSAIEEAVKDFQYCSSNNSISQIVSGDDSIAKLQSSRKRGQGTLNFANKVKKKKTTG